ncbi:MAG: hypothetical protein RID91_17475 [Azospirillaceae bacterium]
MTGSTGPGSPGATPFDPASTYVEVADGGRATAIPVDSGFWPSLMDGSRRIDGRLLAAFDLDGDMRHWERHPAGEELIVLVSGAVDLIVETPDGRHETVALRAEAPAVLVPAGLWHRFVVHEPGRALFLTAGEGTEHRPADPA